MSEQPKPCPFCKSMPIREPEDPIASKGWHYLSCFGADCPAMPGVRGKTEAEAIARWNTRAEDPRDAQLVEVLKGERYSDLKEKELIQELVTATTTVTRKLAQADAQLREAWRMLHEHEEGYYIDGAVDWLRANIAHKPDDISADWLKAE